jgi:16S rRNA processing protein RimM
VVAPQPGETESTSEPLPRRPSLRRRSGGRDAA